MQRTTLWQSVVALFISLGVNADLFAVRGPVQTLSPKSFLHTLGQSINKIHHHRFQPPRFRLTERSWDDFYLGRMSLDEAVDEYLRANYVHPAFELRLDGARPTSRNVRHYQFFLFDVPIFGFALMVRETSDGKVFITGRSPSNLPDMDSETHDLSLATSRSVALEEYPTAVRLESYGRHWFMEEGRLVPVWKIRVFQKSLAFETLVSDRLHYAAPYFYHATGKAYEYNSVLNSDLVEFNFEVDGSGNLQNDNFYTDTGDVSRATAADGEFEFTPDQPEFAEVSAFAHVNRMRDYFAELGYNFGTERILVRLHQTIPDPNGGEGDPNNAVYSPDGVNQSGIPTITIGDGDGVALKDIPFDSDIVSHELGHHIVFRNIKTGSVSESEGQILDTDDHSGILHEGLADFFVFAQSGDACLGESVCPGSGGYCEVEGKCLRSGQNALNHSGGEYWNMTALTGHSRGQLVAGLLWDLMADDTVPQEAVAAMAYQSVDYMTNNATYSDFLIGMMSADAESFQGNYGCKITEVFKARGFETVVTNQVSDCSAFAPESKTGSKTGGGIIPDTNPPGYSEDGIPRGGARRRPEASSSGCGVVGSGGSPITLLGVTVLFLLFGGAAFGRRRDQ